MSIEKISKYPVKPNILYPILKEKPNKNPISVNFYFSYLDIKILKRPVGAFLFPFIYDNFVKEYG